MLKVGDLGLRRFGIAPSQVASPPERPEASLKRILNERIRQSNWLGSTVNIGPLGINVVISDVVPRDAIYFTVPERSTGLMKIAITVDDDQIAPRQSPIVGRIENLHVPEMNMRQSMESMGLNVDEETRRMEQETRFVEEEILRGIGVTTIPAGTTVRKEKKLSPVEVWYA